MTEAGRPEVGRKPVSSLNTADTSPPTGSTADTPILDWLRPLGASEVIG